MPGAASGVGCGLMTEVMPGHVGTAHAVLLRRLTQRLSCKA